METRQSLKSIALVVGLALPTAFGVSIAITSNRKPEIIKYEDMTGDGIKDVLMYEDAFLGSTRGNYLFIGKDDGTFIRTQEKKDENLRYFLSDDGDAYVFDGKFYRLSPKQE